MLELELYTSEGRNKGMLAMCCPEGDCRRGGMQAILQRYGVLLIEALGELRRAVKGRLVRLGRRRAME